MKIPENFVNVYSDNIFGPWIYYEGYVWFSTLMKFFCAQHVLRFKTPIQFCNFSKWLNNIFFGDSQNSYTCAIMFQSLHRNLFW